MLFGNPIIADSVFANAPPGQTFTSFVDALATVEQDLRHPYPWLQLWDVESPNGTLYFADFADPDARGTIKPTQVIFRGNEYTSINISRREFVVAQDGTPRMVASIHDPLRVVDRTVDLEGYAVTLWIARYDLLADGAGSASKIELRIQSMAFRSQPDTVSIALGFPSLTAHDYPPTTFNARLCVNDWNLRFDETNRCTYLGDEFEADTKQDFHSTSAADTALRTAGWRVLNGDKVDGSGDPLTQTSGVLVPSGTDENSLHVVQDGDARWTGANQAGFFAFRLVGDDVLHTVDFDVYAKLVVDTTATTKAEYMVGLLAQSSTDLSDWLFWGLAKDSLGALQYRLRSTTSSVSTDTDTAAGGTPDSEFRFVRSAGGWTLYTRAKSTTARTDNTGTWTQRGTPTLSLASPLRVGLVVASDLSDANIVDAYFAHFRVLSGLGFKTCPRDFESCSARHNTHQFNAWRGMPDGSVFSR